VPLGLAHRGVRHARLCVGMVSKRVGSQNRYRVLACSRRPADGQRFLWRCADKAAIIFLQVPSTDSPNLRRQP
jgi:hypothetical protein